MKLRIIHPLIAGLTLLTSPNPVIAAQITYTGTVYSLNPVCAFPDGLSVRLGIFNPAFDPFRYKFVYGVDDAGNMNETGYNRAVGDGNFTPLGSGFGFRGVDSWKFIGSANVQGIAGQRLWLFLFDNRNPNQASTMALFSGSDSSWFGPPNNGQVTIDASTADIFVFGGGGRGGQIELGILPFPEAPTWSLLGLGLISLLARLRRQHSNCKAEMHRRRHVWSFA